MQLNETDQKAVVDQFEYKVDYLSMNNTSGLQNLLNELGAKGWELASTAHEGKASATIASGQKFEILCIFKRRLG